MLAALLTSTLHVPVLPSFPGTLSVFLAYLYTWYCFLAFFCFKSEKQRYHWKCLFRARLHVNTVPALQVFYIRSFNN